MTLVLGTSAQALTTFRATLAGSRESPSGDPDGEGVAAISIQGTTVYYSVLTRGIAAPTSVLLNSGTSGTTGPVVVSLVTSAGGFVDLGGGAFGASGTVVVDAATAAALTAGPMGYYVNVLNADFTSGALRGQLLGDGFAAGFLATDLKGGRETGGGDGDGDGFGWVRVDGTNVYFSLLTLDIAQPTAAHIHAGVAGASGGVQIGLVTSPGGFQDLGGGAFAALGVVQTTATVAQAVVSSPASFYLNVHNATFPGGAARGQLARAETHVVLPIVSRAQGKAGSNWSTALRIVNPGDEDAAVWLEWFPSNSAGLTGPAKVVPVNVAAGGQGVFDDLVGAILGADGNGSVEVISWAPVGAAAKIFNDQRANPDILGTFGQFAPGLSPTDARTDGAIPLLANRPASSGTDFRSNVGGFNPNPFSVATSFAVRRPDGSILGSTDVTLAPHASFIKGVFDLVSGVSAAQQIQTDMFLTFTAQAPIFVYGSVVDNRTNDAVLPLPVRYGFVPLVTSNRAPDATIIQPAGPVTVAVGDPVTFTGSATDPDADSVAVVWDFADGVTATSLSTAHSFASAGTYVVTLTATDSHGLSDPTPASVTVTVEAASVAPTLTQIQTAIFTPRCSGCHPPNGGGMDLRSGHTWASTVNVDSFEQPTFKRIAPGDANNSYLYQKVLGAAGISGSRMPQGGPFLTAQELEMLRQWIAAGAKDD